MEIAIFGGSFNPPHCGHAGVLRYLSNLKKGANFQFDEIWLMPTHQHPFGKELLDFSERMKLCLLMVKDLGDSGNRIRVSDFEATFPGVNRTVDTLRTLKRLHPDYHYTLVLGSDLKRELPKWQDFPIIDQMAKVVFIPRRGFEKENRGLAQIPFAPEASSNQIRDALKTGKKIDFFLTPSVADYIRKNGLYLEQKK